MKYRPSDYRGREGDESSLCLDPSPIRTLRFLSINRYTFNGLSDNRDVSIKISKKRSFMNNITDRQTIYIYIYLFVFIRFFLSKRKFYVDITRLVIILVIIAKWTSKDGEKRKKFELLPFAVSLDNGDFSHETRIPRHLTVTCRVLTASTRQRSRVGAQRLDTSRRELRRILAIFSRRFLSPRELNNNKRRDANRISVSFLRFWG